MIEPLPPPARRVHAVYHLASPASPPAYQAAPLRTLRTNFEGTLSLLELARRHGARFLLASTSEVYGQAEQHPQRESYNGNVSPHGPRSCYDEGKRVAESLAATFEREYGVDVRVARLFNTYGPRMAPGDGRVVSTFVAQALRGNALTVHGDGRQTRSFCYVADTIRGLRALMEAPACRGAVNLGNPLELTIVELAQHVLHLVPGAPRELVHLRAAPDDPRRRCPDIARARRELGWAPQVDLQRGLALTVRAAKAELGDSMNCV